MNLSDSSYEPVVLGAVAQGKFEHTFVPLTIEAGGHRGVFQVSQDALKIDGVRINVSAVLQQHIADLLGAYLPTPRLFDQMWAQRAITVLPCTQWPVLANTEAMAKHSTCIDMQIAKLGGVPDKGIVQTVGKTWVLSNKLSASIAMNQGWYIEKQIPGVPFDPAPTLAGAHMIQSPGTRHSPSHADYSQIFLAVKRECVVDDQPMDFATVATTPGLAALVTHEGVLKILRQPGAPEMAIPPARVVPPSGATVALAGVGASIGAAIGGPPGAVVGGVAGLAMDAVRRKLIS